MKRFTWSSCQQAHLILRIENLAGNLLLRYNFYLLDPHARGRNLVKRAVACLSQGKLSKLFSTKTGLKNPHFSSAGPLEDTNSWRVPNPPGANPLVAEGALWRSLQVSCDRGSAAYCKSLRIHVISSAHLATPVRPQ